MEGIEPTRSSAPRRLPAMLVALTTFLAIVAAINFVVNPYGAWSPTLVDPHFRAVNGGKARMSVPHRARVEQPRIVLLGNSRVLEGMPISSGIRDGISNLALPAATMDETAALLSLALKSGSPQRIVWEVDFAAFSGHFSGFVDAPTRRRVHGDRWLRARDSLLSFDASIDSWRTFARAIRGLDGLLPDQHAPMPWSAELIAAALEGVRKAELPRWAPVTQTQAADRLAFYRSHSLAEEAMAVFACTVGAIRAAGIELYAFLPPLSLYEMETIRQGDAWPAFLEWKRQVAAITPVWDFSGYEAQASAYPELFDSPAYFHFSPLLGHVILRHALGLSCAACGPVAAQITDAAVRVDQSNIAVHLEAQDAARERFARTNSPYSERVRAVLAQTVTAPGA